MLQSGFICACPLSSSCLVLASWPGLAPGAVSRPRHHQVRLPFAQSGRDFVLLFCMRTNPPWTDSSSDNHLLWPVFRLGGNCPAHRTITEVSSGTTLWLSQVSKSRQDSCSSSPWPLSPFHGYHNHLPVRLQHSILSLLLLPLSNLKISYPGFL